MAKKRFRVTADLVTERELTVMEVSYALTMMLEGWPADKSNELEIERLTVLERPYCTAAPLAGQSVGYQPDGHGPRLDADNPPQGGSGVPTKGGEAA